MRKRLNQKWWKYSYLWAFWRKKRVFEEEKKEKEGKKKEEEKKEEMANLQFGD